MESNKQVTAVQCYNSKVIKLMTQREQGNIDVLEFRNQLDLLFAEADAMFEQQIMDAWDNGYFNGYDLGKYDDGPNPDDAEQYYAETYGKD